METLVLKVSFTVQKRKLGNIGWLVLSLRICTAVVL